MPHGLDLIEPEQRATPPAGAAGPVERVIAAVNQFIVIVSSVALLGAALVLTYSVVVRYFLKFSTDWQDEIVGLLPPRVNQVRQIVVDIASLLFCGFFAWKSWILLDEAIVENFHSGSTWGPPLWIPYSLMTVGMTLLALQLLIQIVNELRRGPVAA
jgi:TRAP-type C4-dicarboxylate transport system permease small subunit